MYARSKAWDLFSSPFNGRASGWTHSLAWQHAACLSAALHLYGRHVTALAESPGQGVATLAGPEIALSAHKPRRAVLVVIGGARAPAHDGTAVH